MLLDLNLALAQQDIVSSPSKGLNVIQPFSFSIEAELEDNKENSFLTPRPTQSQSQRSRNQRQCRISSSKSPGYTTIAVIPHSDDEGADVERDKPAKKPAAKKAAAEERTGGKSVVKRQRNGLNVGFRRRRELTTGRMVLICDQRVSSIESH